MAGILAPVLSVWVVPLCAILTCCGRTCLVICESRSVEVVRKERDADEANMLTLCVLWVGVFGSRLVSLHCTQKEGSLSSWRAMSFRGSKTMMSQGSPQPSWCRWRRRELDGRWRTFDLGKTGSGRHTRPLLRMVSISTLLSGCDDV